MRLNLGAADRRIEGFISVDIAPPADQIVDLAAPWPWPDSSVNEVMALDVCEHIADADVREHWVYTAPDDPDGELIPNGRTHFLNELHRVLKPGARATIETPNAARGVGFPCDPTHVSPWCLSTFRYFEVGAFAHTRLAKSYGITAAFKVIELSEARFPAEFSPAMAANPVDPPMGVWVPARAEVAWKIRAVLEAVKS